MWRARRSLWGEIKRKDEQADREALARIVPDTLLARQLKQYDDGPECELRFAGQWEDEESGLHYNLHRYYDPNTGQYLSSDPIGLNGGLRTHAYVHDPVQWIDPAGLAGYGSRASDPRSLFRGDERSPSTIFKEGFRPRGTSTDLNRYVNENNPNTYVGTSTSSEVARSFAEQQDGGYVYTICDQLRGLNVINELGLTPDNPFYHEFEITVPGGVDPVDIIGAQQAALDGSLIGPFIENPAYGVPKP